MALVDLVRELLLLLGQTFYSNPFLTVLACLLTICLITGAYTRVSYAKAQADDAPKEPGTLPFWVPFLGHAFPYVVNNAKLMKDARDSSRDGVYTIRLASYKHYMILTPSLVEQVFAQRATVLSNKPLMYWLAKYGFADGGATAKVSDLHSKITSNLSVLMTESATMDASNRTAKAIGQNIPLLISFAQDPAKQQYWERASGARLVADNFVETDLFRLVTRWTYTCSTPTMFGQAFLDKFPHLMDDIFVFDDAFPLLLTGLPSFTRKMGLAQTARDRLLKAIESWFKAMQAIEQGNDPGPGWGDMKDVSTLAKMQHQAWQSGGEEAEKAAYANLTSLLWGFHSNSNIIFFWVLTHIYSSHSLLTSIRAEIAPHITRSASGEYSFDHTALSRSCPLLKSTWLETMRCDVTGVAQKYIEQDFSITESLHDAELLRGAGATPRTYLLKAGNVTCVHDGASQSDPRLWKDPAEFDARRFIVHDSQHQGHGEVAKMPRSLHSFGGGYSMCKGRLFAEREVLCFAAAVVHVWDIDYLGPRAADGSWFVKKAMEAGAPHPAGDVKVRLSKRQKE